MSAAKVALGFQTPPVCSARVISVSSGLPSMSFMSVAFLRFLDGFLQLLSGSESDLLAGLDLDSLAGRGIASHACRALAHLQNAETAHANAPALLQVASDGIDH